MERIRVQTFFPKELTFFEQNENEQCPNLVVNKGNKQVIRPEVQLELLTALRFF